LFVKEKATLSEWLVTLILALSAIVQASGGSASI